ELLPPVGSVIAQKTEDIIGPYELHDFFLYYFVRYRFDAKKVLFLAQKSFSGKYNDEEIKKVLKIFIKRFFQNQWKRDCVPAGVKVGSVDLSPRGSWRMPADADSSGFLDF
ncbi:MAG: NAD(+) synthase, partial [Spirochaetes bacterium]|nr:NAD(+) synthase [Spirochaetota bacterium]